MRRRCYRVLRGRGVARVRLMALALCAALLALALAGAARPWIALFGLGLLGVIAAWPKQPARPEAMGRFARRRDPAAFEQRLRSVLDALCAPTILVDARGTVIHANAEALAAFPVLRMGAPVFHAIRQPRMMEALQGVIRERSAARFDLVERIPLERSFDVHIRALAGAENEAASAADAVIFMPETTAARRLESMRADFVANASHELRTPLASIMGFIETLKGPARNDSAARARFLDIMEGQARRMARLIEDLLSLSKIEMSEHIPPSGRVELGGAIRSVLDALSGLARERGVVFETEFAPGEHVIAAERDEVLRVLDNLVENGIKYGQSGGRLRITLAARRDDGLGPAIAVAVKDFGPGIAPEHLPRLTERFYRADTHASRGQGGTGLGLAIVKHIMTRHRGRLGIESRPGEGATFTLWFPAGTEAGKPMTTRG